MSVGGNLSAKNWADAQQPPEGNCIQASLPVLIWHQGEVNPTQECSPTTNGYTLEPYLQGKEVTEQTLLSHCFMQVTS